MSALTGYPLAIGALMIGRGEIDAPGVQSPESCVDADSFLAELGKRGVVVYQGEDFAERIN
jgi:saccharopine dehydrogenase-like NADP-dependent oxidoreductase